MEFVSSSIWMSEFASQRKCQELHLSFVSDGSIAAVAIQDFLTGLRSLYLVMKSVSAPATDEPLPWDAGIYRFLRLDRALLRVYLIVKRHDLDLLAEYQEA